MRQGKAQSGISRQATVRCSACKETGHNLRICKNNTKIAA